VRFKSKRQSPLTACCATLDSILTHRRGEIHRLLTSYGVRLVDGPGRALP